MTKPEVGIIDKLLWQVQRTGGEYSGFRLNENLLIPFGVVMGEAFGFLVSTYFYELKQVDGLVNRIDGLKEGVGDIVGGLLGAVIASLTAYFTVRWQFDRDEARRAEEKQTAAETLLMAVTSLVPTIESIDAAMAGTSPEDTLIFSKNSLGSYLEW